MLAVALATLIGGVAAQAQPAAEPHSEYDLLFQSILRDPANLDLNFRFAEVSTRLGDYEAAIGALERILFYNPNLPRVKLELGVLYFKLGSYQMARTYFTGAIEAPDTPGDVRFRVQNYLAEIDRRLSTNQFSLYAQGGYRYQTNANAGPSSPFVRALGQDAVLDRQFVNRPDWNAFGLTAIRHVYDFENQRGDVWETSLAGYYAAQARFTRLNLGFLELQTGPRLAVEPELLPGVSVRPYLLTNGVTLGDNRYLTTRGGGVALTIPVGGFMTLEPFVEGRDRRFSYSAEYPNAKEQTGRLWTTGLLAGGALAGPFRWQARAAYARNDAQPRFDYNSYDQVAFDLGFPVEFESPVGNGKSWALIPTFGWARYDYDQPNPLIDPVVKRRDRELRTGLLLDMPLYEFAGMAVQVLYSTIDSKLPNYDTHNLSVTFGPTVRF